MEAAIAFARFGLGRRKDEPVPADARAWLGAQLAGPDTAPSDGLQTSQALIAQLYALNEAEKQMAADPAHKDEKNLYTPLVQGTRKQEIDAILAQAITTPSGFRERLVWFWYNHFTVATRTRMTNLLAGAYIREAIRPHVTGTFTDMLLAVMRHPAMLDYLDQLSSVGPDSPAGERTHRGLNENLARECLELHTVTPAAGYTQADVTNFAKILTGWSMENRHAPIGFTFRPRAHEPGPQTVMGRAWPQGEAGGVAILEWLGTHPSTYHHLATKLVRHFVADDPPEADVIRIEQILAATNGDLGAAAHGLIDLPGAWQPLGKLRTPFEYVVAVMRAAGAHPELHPNLPGIIANLGQPVFEAPFPIGWPDRAADWSNPEAMLQRVDFAYQFADRINDQEPVDVAHTAMGTLMTAETLDAVRGAASRRDGIMLALACPEMQRR